MTRSIRLTALSALATVVLAPSAGSWAVAQTPCARSTTNGQRSWPAPLDRLVSLHERGVALREALDRLAAAARLRLAYSAELLPLDRRVCAVYRSAPAGVVLTDLLTGSSVEPVVW